MCVFNPNLGNFTRRRDRWIWTRSKERLSEEGKQRDQPDVSITVHLFAQRGLSTLCSHCCLASQDPWLVSGLLIAFSHVWSGSLCTISLLIISSVRATLRKSRSTVSKPSGGSGVTQDCVHDILVSGFYFYLFFLKFPFFKLLYKTVSAASDWLDIIWLLKNVGVKPALIYDMISSLSFWPQHYCQGAAVIRHKFSSGSQPCDTPIYLGLQSTD